MPKTLLRWLPLALLILAALGLRTRDLAARPMHADEANQAVKAGELLESGRYAYDPGDHHGPVLYYAVLPVAWCRGERTLAGLDELTVRLVPAPAGPACVLLLGLLPPARPLALAGGGGLPGGVPAGGLLQPVFRAGDASLGLRAGGLRLRAAVVVDGTDPLGRGGRGLRGPHAGVQGERPVVPPCGARRAPRRPPAAGFPRGPAPGARRPSQIGRAH